VKTRFQVIVALLAAGLVAPWLIVDQRSLAQPSAHEQLIREARAAYERKSYEQAIVKATEAIQQNANSWQAFEIRASASRATGNLDRALADLSEAIRIANKNPSLYCQRAFVHYHKASWNLMKSDCDQALQLDSTDPQAYAYLAIALRGLKQLDQALVAANKAIELDSDYAFGYAVRAETHNYMMRFDNVSKDYEHALKLERYWWYEIMYARFLATCHDAKYRNGRLALSLEPVIDLLAVDGSLCGYGHDKEVVSE